MNQTITVSTKTVDKILARLDSLTHEVKTIKEKLFEEEPPYGSDEWWEWSDRKAMEDIKAGRYKTYNNVKDLIKDLHAGK